MSQNVISGSSAGGHRLSVRVPPNESWMDQWWAAQVQPSASMRLLVSRFIAEHGVTDVFSALVNSTSEATGPAINPDRTDKETNS